MTGRKIGCQSRNGRSTGKETCRGEMEGELLEMDGLWSENNAVTTHIRDCLPEILGWGGNRTQKCIVIWDLRDQEAL